MRLMPRIASHTTSSVRFIRGAIYALLDPSAFADRAAPRAPSMNLSEGHLAMSQNECLCLERTYIPNAY
jgi:hypothetical protein